MKQVIPLSLITLGLILAGVATLNAFLIILALPFFLYTLTGLVAPQPQLNLKFHRQLSTERTTPGEPVTISITVTNQGQKLEALHIEDLLHPNLTVITGAPDCLVTLDTGESFSWSYVITGKRGYYLLDKIKVEIRSFLGLSPYHHDLPISGCLFILPKVINMKKVAIRPYWTRAYAGEIPSRSGGQGTDFFGIRRYQPGDPPNRINWRASARDPALLFSNEFEQDRVSDVGIILDGRERTNIISSAVSIFEFSVLAAATLAASFINQGDRVGLLNYGKYLEWTFPGYGKIQLEKILRALSRANPGRSLVFSYLEYIPTKLFPPKSQIVLISPLSPEDPEVLLQIRARGYQVLVISPDPISYEARTLQSTSESLLAMRILNMERNLLINKLLMGGIRVLNWDTSRPLEQVIAQLQLFPDVYRTIQVTE